MSAVIVNSDVTDESFRKDDKFRGQAKDFFQSPCGAHLLFLLKKKTEFRNRKEAVPHDAIANYSIAELSRHAGIQEVIDLIKSLCEPPPKEPEKKAMPQLDSKSEVGLPAKFVVNKKPPAK